jgi:hypothetical protein
MLGAASVAIFFLSLLAAVSGMVWFIVNTVRASRFIPAAYEKGKATVNFTVPLGKQFQATEAFQAGEHETSHAVFKFVTPSKCFFGEHLVTLRPSMFLRGTIEFEKSEARIDGRLPTGVIVFYVGFLTGWFTGQLNMFFGATPVRPPFLLVGMISDVALIVVPVVSIMLQKMTFRKLAYEVLEMIVGDVERG